jgi:protein arginine kinase
MSLEKFMNHAVSSWMNDEGPHADIVLSSRIRLARNLEEYKFPTLFTGEEALKIVHEVGEALKHYPGMKNNPLELLLMNELQPLQRRVLVEKHLISPLLAEGANYGAAFLSENEDISIMINEEDHIRIQCLASGLQLKETLVKANEIDDVIEEKVQYAFDEKIGYLTSCPTNVGTGLRASVMVHLPALVMTHQMNQIVPAINQLGLVVRGIYGEGSQSEGNLFQISNQLTLGKSEEEIVDDLISVVFQIIDQERSAREALVKTNKIQLEDKIFRSYGVLATSRIIESKEAAQCLSDVRLGIDLGYINNISKRTLNELMIMTQPGFLQQVAGTPLRPEERDVHRAALIREKLRLEHGL